jgi:PEP-CTERM motif
MRMLPIVLVLVGAGAGPAAAGPIWFSYRVDGVTTQQGSGEFFFQPSQSNPIRLDSAAGVELASLQFVRTPPVLSDDGNGPAVTDGVSRFAVNVQLTDTVTRLTNTVSLTGWAAYKPNGIDGLDPAKAVVLAFDGDPSRDVRIGDATVRITAVGSTNAGSDEAFGTVSAQMLTQPAPEPGTIVLAGVGIAGLIGAAGRRRVKPSS